MSLSEQQPSTSLSFEQKLNVITHLAEKIRNAKEVSINLDNERQKYRECKRNIQKNDINPVWVFNGNTFIKTTKENSVKVLETDTLTVENAIGQIKDVIKKDTDTLLKMKGEKGLEERGFDLKPLLIDGKIS